MFQLGNLALNTADENELTKLQNGVDGEADYAARVFKAASDFAVKPAPLFRRIREALAHNAGDLVRCCYCEDSCADEVEHVRPKSFFPEAVFTPANYVFACGPCNGTKNNKYKVNASGTQVDLVAHRRQNGVVSPPTGAALFLDPRSENPLDFIWLDLLAQTYTFDSILDEESFERDRAKETITSLRLNREPLRKSRENAYGGYRDRLAQLIERNKVGAEPTEIESRRRDLARSPHRTVWLEMKRQRPLIPELTSMFAEYPEALQL